MAKKKAAAKKESKKLKRRNFTGPPLRELYLWITGGDESVDMDQLLFAKYRTAEQITRKASKYVSEHLKPGEEMIPLKWKALRERVKETLGKYPKPKIVRNRPAKSKKKKSIIAPYQQQDPLAAVCWFMVDSLPYDYDRPIPPEVQALADSYSPPSNLSPIVSEETQPAEGNGKAKVDFNVEVDSGEEERASDGQ